MGRTVIRGSQGGSITENQRVVNNIRLGTRNRSPQKYHASAMAGSVVYYEAKVFYLLNLYIIL